jgi:hypothetical protein
MLTPPTTTALSAARLPTRAKWVDLFPDKNNVAHQCLIVAVQSFPTSAV